MKGRLYLNRVYLRQKRIKEIMDMEPKVSFVPYKNIMEIPYFQ